MGVCSRSGIRRFTRFNAMKRGVVKGSGSSRLIVLSNRLYKLRDVSFLDGVRLGISRRQGFDIHRVGAGQWLSVRVFKGNGPSSVRTVNHTLFQRRWLPPFVVHIYLPQRTGGGYSVQSLLYSIQCLTEPARRICPSRSCWLPSLCVAIAGYPRNHQTTSSLGSV